MNLNPASTTFELCEGDSDYHQGECLISITTLHIGASGRVLAGRYGEDGSSIVEGRSKDLPGSAAG